MNNALKAGGIAPSFCLPILLLAASLHGFNAELVIGDHTVSALVREGRLAFARMANRQRTIDNTVAKEPKVTSGERGLHSATVEGQGVFLTAQAGASPVGQSDTSPSSDNGEAKAVLACYNAHSSSISIGLEDYVNGRVDSSLQIRRLWWSKQASTHPLALFTQLSFNRAEDLEALCRSYPGGVVAAAVWVPILTKRTAATETTASASTVKSRRLLQQLEQPTGAISPGTQAAHGATSTSASGDLLQSTIVSFADLFRRLESAPAGAACSLRLFVVSEFVAEPQLAVLPPVSALRNLALLAIDTPLASMVDVDLSVSASLAGIIMNEGARTADLIKRAEAQRLAWVMPSWDVSHTLAEERQRAVADAAVAVSPKSKQTLVDMWRMNEIFPSTSERYTPSFNATDYERWAKGAEEYPIEYQEGYEPWFFGARRLMPLYDDRFRGHHYSSVSNVRHAVRSKALNLAVIPDAWTVHRLHGGAPVPDDNDFGRMSKALGFAESPMDKLVTVGGSVAQPRRTYTKAAMAFFGAARAAQDAGTYTPVVHAAVQRCREVLPWWRP